MTGASFTNSECVALLQWALPRLGLRWPGYRKVRGQICKRIRRRMSALELCDAHAYRERLECEPSEWAVLERLCVVTISRFYRDKKVWETLGDEVLPAVAKRASAAGAAELRCWSIGCASGEEPHTLAIVWLLKLAHRYPDLRLRVLATDVDEKVLERAAAARYPAGSLRDLPADWLARAFEPVDGEFRLRDQFRSVVELRREDVRSSLPDERFELILCRNMAFTYFDACRQREVLDRIASRLSAHGVLVLGRHEQLPVSTQFEAWYPELGIHRLLRTDGSLASDAPAR